MTSGWRSHGGVRGAVRFRGSRSLVRRVFFVVETIQIDLLCVFDGRRGELGAVLLFGPVEHVMDSTDGDGCGRGQHGWR